MVARDAKNARVSYLAQLYTISDVSRFVRIRMWTAPCSPN